MLNISRNKQNHGVVEMRAFLLCREREKQLDHQEVDGEKSLFFYILFFV